MNNESSQVVLKNERIFLKQLCDFIEKTDKSWYHVPKHTLFHDLVCLIISQRISFSLGRQIRQKLRTEHERISKKDNISPEPNLTADIVKKIDLKAIGISNNNLINCINVVTNFELEGKLELKEITNIKGIGDWTYKSLLIMGHRSEEHPQNPQIFLKEDAWIRKRLAEIVSGKPKNLTIKEAEKIINDNLCDLGETNLTDLSLFLWRIKESGVEKIRKNKEPLLREDFL